jgi:hypothetical protein
MYPYRSLPENLAAFSAELRREHGFRIGPRELQDAARALVVTRLSDERSVRDSLRPVLCSTAADVAVFDRAFDVFFHPATRTTGLEGAGRTPVRQHAPDGPEPEHEALAFRPAEDSDQDVAEVSTVRQELVSPSDIDEAAGEGAMAVVRSSYSPADAEGAAPYLAMDPVWRAAASAFVAALRLGRSRRWRPAHHGQRFDLRRTLRHSLHTGGEPVMPRWQTRLRRRPRVVLLVDGSRSMAGHAQVALDMAVAFASITSTLEAFTFSTTLERITREVRRAAAGERVRLDHLHRAWGGGTIIGASLQAFVQRFGERVLSRDTVVVVASDGLDVGAAGVVREVMARLRRRSAGVIWLNPLLETPGYEPTALGMRAARPYVSTFACVSDPASLLRLSRAVRVRG